MVLPAKVTDVAQEAPAHAVPSATLSRFWRPSLQDIESGAKDTQAHRYLNEQALWAGRLLSDLVEGKGASPYDRLNAHMLNACEGLAFINAKKGGLGVTFGHGYGFVIKKLAQDAHGNSTWSQPLFFMVSQAGLGISAGFQHCQSLIALSSIRAMDVFKIGTTSLGTELGQFSTDGALMGMSGGAAMGQSQHLGLSVANTHSAFCYSKVDGVYLELSMHGSSVSPDRESNEALYGANYDPDLVLSKGGAYMPDLLPLLRTINAYGRAAVTGNPTPGQPTLVPTA